MAQHDYVIANGTGAAVRSDLNNALAAIVSQNSGATEPATMYAYQWWADTTTGLLKLRNGANNAWITLRELDGTLTIEAGTVSAPGLAFASDLNTGVWSPGADQFAIATNGVERVEWGTSEVVFNDGGANYDFRIEGDTNANLFFVDASAEAVGIGDTAPSDKVTIAGGASGSYGLTINNAQEGGGTKAFLQFDRDNQIAVLAGVTTNGLSFKTLTGGSTTEKARLDSSGRLLVGTSSARTNVGTFVPQMQIEGLGVSASTFSLTNNAADSTGAYLFLTKTRGTSIGSNTIVQNNDIIGGLYFVGADGVDTQQAAAYIQGEVDGTPGSNDMPGRLVFSTTADGASSPTERMRITSGGEILIGVTSVPTAGNVNGTALNAAYLGDVASMISAETSTGGSYRIVFLNSNGLVGSISTSGSGTSYTTSSDYRLKENVVAVTDSISRLQQLKPSRFNFIANPNTVVDGFIAHEAAEVVPECVTGEKDAVDDDGNPVYQGIDQSKLVPLLTAALQEAIAKIESLEARLTAAGIE